MSRREYAVIDENDDEKRIETCCEHVRLPVFCKRVGPVFRMELGVPVVHEDESEYVCYPIAEDNEWEEEWRVEERKYKPECIRHRYVGEDVVPWREWREPEADKDEYTMPPGP